MVSAVLRGFIRLYQLLVSPLLGPRCRYWPSCSEYAAQAIHDRREVFEARPRSVVQAVVDRDDDNVLSAVEEPLEPDRLARRHA